VLHGETRPSRVNYLEPRPVEGDPEPPETLSEEALRVWDYTVAKLRPTRVLTEADRDALAVYCEHVVNHTDLLGLLRRSAYLVKSSRGDAVRNPLVSMARQEAELVRGFMHEFGLTPSARSGIVVAPDSTDEIERILSR
jgi:P27 family predicted phage terminase small subunit